MPTHITIQTTESTLANPLDLWQIEIEAALPPDGESFGLEDDESIWSISLPGDTILAEKRLARRLDNLSQRQQAIDAAGQFLQGINIPDDEYLTFDIGQANDLTEEEGILLATMANYSQLAEAESFAFDWLAKWHKPVKSFNQTLEECQLFMKQAAYLFKPNIRIETDIERTLLAQTLVRAGGDMETLWHRRAEPTQMVLHRRTTQLTLETRQSLAFFLAQVSVGAASLVAKFYVAHWVALPAAFRFVQDVLRRAREDKLLARMEALRER